MSCSVGLALLVSRVKIECVHPRPEKYVEATTNTQMFLIELLMTLNEYYMIRAVFTLECSANVFPYFLLKCRCLLPTPSLLPLFFEVKYTYSSVFACRQMAILASFCIYSGESRVSLYLTLR